jgi:hypothetical protein
MTKKTEPTFYSYVVDHDLGFAPNPENGMCTLVHCLFKGHYRKRRNIVELAKVGDWILGSGGKGRDTAGNGKIIYLMRVDEKPSFAEYMADPRFAGRRDHADFNQGNQFALISHHYFYFGRNAIDVAQLPKAIPKKTLFKTGQGFRRDLPEPMLLRLIEWFEDNYPPGMHGQPCGPKV